MITAGLFYTNLLSLCRREVFLKLHAEAYFRESKLAASSEGSATHGFDIRTYLIFGSLSAQDKMYPEKKRPQPKDRKIALVAHNKMSKVWAFLFQNLAK